MNASEVLKALVTHELEIEKTISCEAPTYKKGKVNVASLFCGSGGFDMGILLAGKEIAMQRTISLNNETAFKQAESVAHVAYALDYYKEAIETYKRHHPDTTAQQANIRHLKEFPVSDLLAFGFPCPGFSASGPRNIKDERNFLYVHCCRALQQTKPKAFIAENVPGILTLQKGEVVKAIIKDFEDCGYRVTVFKVNARDYGVCQTRERVIFVGIRQDIPYIYEVPKPTHGTHTTPFVTLQDCIGDLVERTDMTLYEGSYSSQYMSRNRKKSWSEQSFTILASARQAPMHPMGLPMKKIHGEKWSFEGEVNRRLSVQEAARIQSFPDWYAFVGKGKENALAESYFTQIGNAVPPLLARAIAKPIVEYLTTICE